MNESIREAVGFICRWCLLGMSVLIVLAGAWSGVLAAAAIGDGLGSSMIVSDALWAPRENMVMLGYLSSDYFARKPVVICEQPTTGRQTLAWAWRDRFYVRIEHARPGVNFVTVKGFPHSGLAFADQQAIFQLVPNRDRTIFLVDARTALKPSGADDRQFRDVFNEAARRGEVAFFCPGSVGDFVDLRARARKLYPSTPILCTVRKKPDTMSALGNTAWALKRSDRKALVVITGDPELAGKSASQGFTTFLIAAGVQRPSRGKLHVCESLVKFKEYLAAMPIP